MGERRGDLSAMKTLLALATAGLLAGCAVYSDAEFAQLSAAHLAPATMLKLERREPLDPVDLVEMRRRHVPDPLTVRQLNRVGVDSLITRQDIVQMRRAGVSERVIDSSITASDRFADTHAPAILYDAGYHEPFGLHGSLGWGWYGCF